LDIQEELSSLSINFIIDFFFSWCASKFRLGFLFQALFLKKAINFCLTRGCPTGYSQVV
jgi:hypothetical protein